MSLDQDLVRLVKEVVKAELNSSRTNATEVVGRGGDTVLSSMGNIYIQPGTNKKAYYHETEIGSGSGSGAVTSVFGRTGAVNAVGTDYSDVNMQFNSYYGHLFYGDAVYIGYISGYLAGAAKGVAIVPQVGTSPGIIYIGEHPGAGHANGLSITDSGASLKTTKGVLNLQANSDITITGNGNITISPVAGYIDLVGLTKPGMLQIYSASGADPGGVNGYLYYNSTNNKFRAYQNGAWIDAIGGVTDHGALTGLTDDDHTQYLLLTAGSGRKLTGDLYLNATNASIYLQAGGVSYGILNSSASSFDIYGNGVPTSIGGYSYVLTEYGSSILFKTGGTTTRLTIADAAITAAVDVVLGTNKLRGTAGGGSDVILGDDLSGLKAASTYADIKNIGTITPGSTGTKDLGSSSLFWNELFAQIHYVETTTLKIDKNGSNMRFTIPSGGVYEFVVSA